MVLAFTFMGALLLALRAVRGGIAAHRRWMIRAFAVAVGTIRVFVGILQALQLASLGHSFGIAFWPAFIVNAVAAEIHLAAPARPRRRHPIDRGLS